MWAILRTMILREKEYGDFGSIMRESSVRLCDFFLLNFWHTFEELQLNSNSILLKHKKSRYLVLSIKTITWHNNTSVSSTPNVYHLTLCALFHFSFHIISCSSQNIWVRIFLCTLVVLLVLHLMSSGVYCKASELWEFEHNKLSKQRYGMLINEQLNVPSNEWNVW